VPDEILTSVRTGSSILTVTLREGYFMGPVEIETPIISQTKERVMRIAMMLVIVACLTTVAPAQQAPLTPGQVPDFVMARLPDKDTLVVAQTVPVPVVEEQAYTVAVPVMKKVVVNGETKTVTEYVTEQRTRRVTVNRFETREMSLAAAACRFYQMSGVQVSPSQLAERLATAQPALLVSAGDRVSRHFRSIIKPDTLLIVAPRQEESSPFEVPDPVGPPAEVPPPPPVAP
jgi:hypothetical protein